MHKGLARKVLFGAVATAMLAAAPVAKAEQFINILTGGTSGVYYPLGVALSQIYNDNIEGARAQVQSTKASVENLNLLQQGRGELAFALGDSVKLGWEGNTEAGVLASGQVAGIIDDLPSCAELIQTIVGDAVKHLQAAAALVE